MSSRGATTRYNPRLTDQKNTPAKKARGVKENELMINGDDFMPKECFFTKGVGRHKEKLMSFELALRDAGIEKQNLVRVSSIYPTSCRIIPKNDGTPKLKPGQITFVVLAEAATDEPNRLICAGIGLAIPKNHVHGYIAEHHGYGMSEKKTEDLCEDRRRRWRGRPRAFRSAPS